MTKRSNLFTPKKNLSKLKIWLSGAIPEQKHWMHPLIDRDILEFVSFFSAIVFQKGGTIVHGSHPVFTPILVKQSERFAKNKSQLQLYVSSLWGDAGIKKNKDFCEINLVESYMSSKDVTNPVIRNKSLTSLRETLGMHSHCIVSIGGKKHIESDFIAGVSEEILTAKRLRLPCYNIASFGGDSETVDVDNPFLSTEEATKLEHSDGVSFLISSLVYFLARDRFKIQFFATIYKLLGKIK